MTQDLSSDEVPLRALFDELHAPQSLSYFTGVATGRDHRSAASHRRRTWREPAGAIAVILAVVGLAAVGYFAFRAARLAEDSASSGWEMLSGPADGPVDSVACTSAGVCWAVGSNVARYQYSAWTDLKIRTPQGTTLRGVACPTTSECWAVGTVAGLSSSRPVLVQYARGSWNVVPFDWSGATSQGTFATLNAVACADVSHCVAVGSVVSGNEPSPQPLIVSYSGRGWEAQAGAPELHGALNAIACPSATDCWAVGSGNSEPLVIHYSGAEWTGPTQINAPSSALLNAVSCTSTSNCWAVGSSGSGDALQPFIEHYASQEWAISASPRITAAGGAEFLGVACTASDACWVIGDYPGGGSLLNGNGVSDSPSSGIASPLIAGYASGRWTVTSVPTLPAAGAFTAITCSANEGCVAVGTTSAKLG
jgi:hypothetical protein